MSGSIGTGGTVVQGFPASAPAVNATGTFTDVWLRYFQSLWTRTGGAAGGNLVTLSNDVTAAQAAAVAAQAAAANAVPLIGGTMTGPLVLSGAPTVALDAATKGYVDAGVESAVEAGATAAITSGTINGVTIGGTTPGAALFTTLGATSPFSLNSQIAASLQMWGAGTNAYGFGVAAGELQGFVPAGQAQTLRSGGYGGTLLWKVDGSGNATASGFVKCTTVAPSIAIGLTAAGTTLATALAITTTTAIISTCAAGAGVLLPVPSNAGEIHYIRNRAANALLVYPQSGASIEALGASVAASVAVGADATFIASTTTTWTM